MAAWLASFARLSSVCYRAYNIVFYVSQIAFRVCVPSHRACRDALIGQWLPLYFLPWRNDADSHTDNARNGT